MAEVFQEPPRTPGELQQQLTPVFRAIAATVLTGLAGLVALAVLVLAAKGFVWIVRL